MMRSTRHRKPFRVAHGGDPGEPINNRFRDIDRSLELATEGSRRSPVRSPTTVPNVIPRVGHMNARSGHGGGATASAGRRTARACRQGDDSAGSHP